MADSFRPGKILSAADLNRIERLAERAGSPSVGPPLEVIRSPIGNLHRQIPAPGEIWAKITGKILSTGGGSAAPYCYSGQQQLDSLPAPTDASPVADEGGGIQFFADALPLVEISGNAGIATGTLVRAFQGNGPYYVFSPGGSGDTTLRITAPPLQDGNGVWYYPAIIQNADPILSPNLTLPNALGFASINWDTTAGVITVSYTYSAMTITPSANAWVNCETTYALGTSIDQTIGGNGSAFRDCINIGKNYDPISVGHATDGPYLLPVYQTDLVAGLIDSGCNSADGTIGGTRNESIN